MMPALHSSTPSSIPIDLDRPGTSKDSHTLDVSDNILTDSDTICHVMFAIVLATLRISVLYVYALYMRFGAKALRMTKYTVGQSRADDVYKRLL